MRVIALLLVLGICSCGLDLKSNKLVGKWELVQTVYKEPTGDTTIDHEYDFRLDFGDEGFYNYDIQGKHYNHMHYQMKEDTISMEVGKEKLDSKLKIEFLSPNKICITNLSPPETKFIFEKTSK